MNTPLTLDDPARYFARLDDFEAQHWWPRSMRRIAMGWISTAIGARRGLTVIDVGCGNGRMVESIASLNAVELAIGLEPAAEALARSGRRVGKAYVRGSALKLPFDDMSADLITTLDVLQHLSAGSDRVALGECYRVLRPGGLLLIRANAGGREGYRLVGLCSRVREAGFQTLRASYVNSLPALAQEVRGRLLRGDGRARSHPEGGGLPEASPKGWGSRLMGGIAAVEAEVSVRLRLNLPFGHGTMILARRN